MRCSTRTMKGPLRLLLFVFAVIFALTGCDDDSGNNADHSDGPPARTAFLTMDIQDAENGFTDPAPGKYDIREGTPFAISATPDTGFMFSHWETSVNGTVANPENAETTVTLTGDATITPHFDTKAFITIKVSPAGRGYTRPMTGKPVAIAKGDTLDLTADPAPGYHFRRWRIDGGADIAEPENMQTSAAVSADCVITADFGETIVKFNGIVNTSAYTVDPAASGGPETMARLIWPEAVSPFCVTGEDFTYHVYRSASKALADIYRPENKVEQLNGGLQAEIAVDPDRDVTYFLVVAEDLEGNRSKNHRVMPVHPVGAVTYVGDPPIDLKQLGADKITVSAEDHSVTLHGGDWRYLFKYDQDFILVGDGPVTTKVRRSKPRFDGKNTIIEYRDMPFRGVVEKGGFHFNSALPMMSLLPVQSPDTVLENPDLPPDFAREIRAFERSDTPLYVSPDGNMMVWAPDGNGARDDIRDDGKPIKIADGVFVTLHAKPDFAVSTIHKQNDAGETEFFEIRFLGTLNLEAELSADINGSVEIHTDWEKHLERKKKFFHIVGYVPIWHEYEFFVEVRFNGVIDAAVDIEASARLRKAINMGYKYTPETGWRRFAFQGGNIKNDFSMAGEAGLDVQLKARPTIKAAFESSAYAKAKILGHSHLMAESNFNYLDFYPFYLNDLRFTTSASAKMGFDFKPFGQILYHKYVSMWLVEPMAVYSLPEIYTYDIIPDAIIIDVNEDEGEEDLEPRVIEDCASYVIREGENCPRAGAAQWRLQRQQTSGSWTDVPSSPYIQVNWPKVSPWKPPLNEYYQDMDLYIDEQLPEGRYRIVVETRTDGWLGSLETRKNVAARFTVQKYY